MRVRLRRLGPVERAGGEDRLGRRGGSVFVALALSLALMAPAFMANAQEEGPVAEVQAQEAAQEAVEPEGTT